MTGNIIKDIPRTRIDYLFLHSWLVEPGFSPDSLRPLIAGGKKWVELTKLHRSELEKAFACEGVCPCGGKHTYPSINGTQSVNCPNCLAYQQQLEKLSLTGSTPGAAKKPKVAEILAKISAAVDGATTVRPLLPVKDEVAAPLTAPTPSRKNNNIPISFFSPTTPVENVM